MASLFRRQSQVADLGLFKYLLQNPKRTKHNNPYITLKKEECFFFGVVGQLVVFGALPTPDLRGE